VFTDERYRRRGYASQVVAAWAADLHRQRKTPFYSYLLENTASHALAISLGTIPFAESTGFV
jgi:predicted GNAT family acetyltransferase